MTDLLEKRSANIKKEDENNLNKKKY